MIKQNKLRKNKKKSGNINFFFKIKFLKICG